MKRVWTALAAAAVLTAALGARAQDADRGAKVFVQCAACHSIDKDGEVRVGPNLWGVYGQKAGRSEDFAYSRQLKAAGLTWDDETLDKWLTAPTKFVPGSLMGFPGLADPEDRKAVIVFLKRHSD
jgi:cytochrome c